MKTVKRQPTSNLIAENKYDREKTKAFKYHAYEHITNRKQSGHPQPWSGIARSAIVLSALGPLKTNSPPGKAYNIPKAIV